MYHNLETKIEQRINIYREKLFRIMSLVIYFVIVEIDKEYFFLINN